MAAPETMGAPKNPKVGTTYTGASGKVYTWDGSAWRLPAGISPTGADIGGPGTAGPSKTGGGGLLDPKVTAIDTTNPNAKPIIDFIAQYLGGMIRRAPDPQRQFTGPMSQLYPRGAPMLAGARFDPTGMGGGGSGNPNPGNDGTFDPGRRPPIPMDPNYVPPPPNTGVDPSTGQPWPTVDPNGGRTPVAPAGPVQPGRERPTLDAMTAAAMMIAPFKAVNQGSTQIRSYQPQYQNQHTANTFNADAFLRSL